MKFLAIILLCLAAATTAAPSSPVKAASPYYTPPVYSEVSYGQHLPSPVYSHHHHHHGYAKPGHVFTGYNGYNHQHGVQYSRTTPTILYSRKIRPTDNKETK